jgi:hypothetical protein
LEFLGRNSGLWEQNKNLELSQEPVTHTSNPSYSGGRDQEDQGSKSTWKNTSPDPISKIPNMKKGWWNGSRCRLWVQVPVLPNNNNKKKNLEFITVPASISNLVNQQYPRFTKPHWLRASGDLCPCVLTRVRFL